MTELFGHINLKNVGRKLNISDFSIKIILIKQQIKLFNLPISPV